MLSLVSPIDALFGTKLQSLLPHFLLVNICVFRHWSLLFSKYDLVHLDCISELQQFTEMKVLPDDERGSHSIQWQK
jgi:hypothetical protein